MKKLLTVIGIIGILGLLPATHASAQWGGGEGGDGGGGGEAASGMTEMMGSLGLDDTQWKKFNDLRRKYHRDTIQLNAKIETAEVDLEELIDNSDMDMKKIGAKIQEIAKLRADLRTYRYQTLKDMRSFITAEQFDTFRWMAMKNGFNFSGGDKEGHGGGEGHSH